MTNEQTRRTQESLNQIVAERAKEEIAKAELLKSDFLIDEIAGFLKGLSIGNGEIAENAKTLHKKLLATA